MKKKILSLGVVAILVVMLIVLTGCGNNNGEQTETNNSKVSKNSLATVVKIGDYVEYKTKIGETYSANGEKTGVKSIQVFETTGNEKWRVLSIEDDGTINLISADELTTKNKNYYVVDGVLGYLNFVDELNNICAIYGTGEFAKGARSINLDDYYNLIGWDNLANYYGINSNNDEVRDDIYKAMNSRYGNNGTKVNSQHTNFPDSQGNNGFSTKSEFDISSNVKVDFKSSVVSSNSLQYKTMSIYNKDTLVKEILGKNFWIANTFEDYFNREQYDLEKAWGIYFATSDYEIGAKALAYNIINIRDGNDFGKANYIRPIVTLDANLENNGGSGTAEDPYIISK